MSPKRDYGHLEAWLDKEMLRRNRQATVVLWVWAAGMVAVAVLLYFVLDKVTKGG